MPPWERYQPEAAPFTPPVQAGPWQKFAPPPPTSTDPNEGWGPPGMIVPVQFKEGTGEPRLAMPQVLTDMGNALSSVTKAATGQYGLEIDPATGRPTTMTNEMIGDAMGGASLGLTPLSPAASAGAKFGQGVIKGGAQRMMQRSLVNDGIPLDQVGPRLARLGPDAVVADLGPNLQARSAAIATMPGSGQKTIVDTLSARRAGAPGQLGTNERIIRDVNETLGPAPVPSQVADEVSANKVALRPEYQEVFQGGRAVDTSPIALDLDSMAVNLRGDAQKRAQQIRTMLNVLGTDELDPNPETLFQVRQAIDGILATEQNPQAIGTMTYIRRQVDDLLAGAVPGIKDVDAKFAELARQGEAFSQGQQILRTGPEAPHPADVVEQMVNGAVPQGTMVGPSAVPFRLSQGARADIDRLIGTKANDLLALKQAVGGTGDWNRTKLVAAFGEEKADALLQIIEREVKYGETANLALNGSRTQLLKAAQDDIVGAGPRANPVKSAANFRFGDAIAETADRGLGWISTAARENQNEQLAKALMSGQDNLITLAALATKSPGVMEQAPLAALRALALSNDEAATGAGQLSRTPSYLMSLLTGHGR